VQSALPNFSPEFIVTDDLAGQGFNSYCPITQSFVVWESHHKRAPSGTIRQTPTFSRYIFCGLVGDQRLGRDTRRYIDSILSIGGRPLEIPSRVIRQINDWELAGVWDYTLKASEKTGFSIGQDVTFVSGPFKTFRATVSAIESEARIKLLTYAFGRQAVVCANPGQIEGT
jgi:transcription antitermination factor NusG